jgi:ATP-dependent RNA helicase DeaD
LTTTLSGDVRSGLALPGCASALEAGAVSDAPVAACPASAGAVEYSQGAGADPGAAAPAREASNGTAAISPAADGSAAATLDTSLSIVSSSHSVIEAPFPTASGTDSSARDSAADLLAAAAGLREDAAEAAAAAAGSRRPLSSDGPVEAASGRIEPVVATSGELADAEVGGEQGSSGFAHFGLDPELLHALADLGFVTPSPIQQAAIPELLLGRDLVGQAQTGTGKTAAFSLPLLHRIDRELRAPQVLVLTPTRELAIQVADAIASYAARLPRLRVVPIYGGSDFREQIQQLRRGPQVVVGTPGRVMDHMRQGTLDLGRLSTLVLDEADEMLRMGFIDDVEWVLDQLPQERQVVLFSATMPREIRQLSHRYLRDPAEVTIRTNSADGRRIRQRHLLVHPSQKLEALERVLEAERQEGVIIFARTKAVTLTVAESLESHGYDVAVLNGDVPQAQRERTIERLRDGRVDVLVATDVAARGLDVERIQLVINYDIPFDGEAYVHRIGRTGRAGRRGEAILFLTPRERRFLGGLERAVGQPIEAMDVPANATINQHRLDRLRERLTSSHRTSPVAAQERALLAEIVQRVANECGCSGEELAVAALGLSLAGKPLLLQGEERWAGGAPRQTREGREGRDNREGRERGAPGAPRRSMQEGQDGPPEPHMERFRIEVGWRDRVKPGNIVGAIANEAGLNGRAIGRIRIFDAHSTVDLPRGMPETVFQDLQRLKVMNRELQISRLES